MCVCECVCVCVCVCMCVYFFSHLEPVITKIFRRVERLHLKILRGKNINDIHRSPVHSVRVLSMGKIELIVYLCEIELFEIELFRHLNVCKQ